MSIIVIGIDLAKSIFAAHGVNEAGKGTGQTPGKPGAADAAAIAEAVTRLQMRFVPIKEGH